MSEPALLRIENVTSGYDGPDVLRGISFVVSRGQLVTIVGPNGHGKTTLLRTISGLQRVRSGRVVLGGQVISRLPPHRIAASGIAHVPQGDMLFPEMSVAENLMMGGYLHTDRADLTRRLEEVYALLPRLSERRVQVASTLSGGERRMAGIGRGLMMGGEVLMLDEPSLGLAPLIIEQIYEVIAGLRAAGRTILLVEENPARVAEIADAIHLLDDGRLVWSGLPRELLERGELLETYLGG